MLYLSNAPLNYVFDFFTTCFIIKFMPVQCRDAALKFNNENLSVEYTDIFQ